MKYKFLKYKEVQEIIAAYPNTKASVLADKHDVPVHKIYATAKRYGIKKSPEFLASPDSGRIVKGQSLSPETRFKKGMVSPRKGKKMEFNSKEAAEKSKASRWKKGHKPPNAATNGEIRWREGLGYHFIRIAENHWVLYNRWLWEKHYGKIPEDFNVVFKDGNAKNCALENLECISNAELVLRNNIHDRYPPELVQIMLMKGKLKKEINKLEKNKTDG